MNIEQVKAKQSPFSKVHQLPENLDGKTILITGGTGGLGYASAVESAKRNARVVITARTPSRGTEAVAKIQSESGSSAVSFITMDQTSLTSVVAGAEEFLGLGLPLHVLMCNAGVAFVADDPIHGAEAHLFINVLTHYLLIKKLLHYMQSQPFNSRIILLSSDAYKDFMSSSTNVDWRILFNTTSSKLSETSMTTYLKQGSEAYGRSKLGDLLLARVLAAQLGPDSNVFVNSCHPGAVDTGMAKKTRYAGGWIESISKVAMKLFGSTPQQGALTQLYLAWHPDVESIPIRGTYLVPTGKVASLKPPFATDLRLGEELVAVCDETISRIMGQ